MLLLEVEEWEKKYNMEQYHDLDWVKFVVYSYVRLFESSQLLRPKSETWYDRRVWSLIDTVFEDVPSLKVIR
jgi:hypothetical protein